MKSLYFHNRRVSGDVPAGVTVSRREKLPEGNFRITEYSWGPLSLWFVDSDKFTAKQRHAAYKAFLELKRGNE